MGIDVHDAAPEHLVQMRAVTVEIYVNLCAIDICNTTLVVEVFVVVGKIRLAEVGLRVIDDDLQFFSGGVIQHLFNFRHDFGRFVEYILRQRPAGGVVIDVVLLRP